MSELGAMLRAQEELNRIRGLQRAWVREHGYPPPLSRRRRLWLRIRWWAGAGS